MINEQYRISECIARWGNPASIALMDPACRIFSTPGIPGIIGYKHEANNIIVFGDPLCNPEHTSELMSVFHEEYKNLVKNIIYIAATEKLTQDSLAQACGAAIGIGREIILDPTTDPRSLTGEKAAILRRNCKKAIRNQVVVHEYNEHNAELEKAMEQLGEAWTQGREGPQVYLQNVNIFSHREHKRFFYAQEQGEIVGVLILNRLDAYQGWVISFSMVSEQAAKGTSELLIVSALEILGKEQCRYFAIGTVPIPSIQDIQGLKPLTTWMLRRVYKVVLKVFKLNDRERYWKKFAPTTQSTYLLLSKPKLGVSGVMGIMSALNARK